MSEVGYRAMVNLDAVTPQESYNRSYVLKPLPTAYSLVEVVPPDATK
jgi:hypothetical protein